MADLESGTRGWAFASGLAAMSTALDVLDSGSHVIVSDDLYGGTFRLFERVRRRSADLDFTFIDMTRCERGRARDEAEHADGLGGDTEQSAAEIDRSRGGREDREGAQCDQRFRQHLRQSVGAAADRVRVRHGHPFRDEISEWPLRHGRRRGGRRREQGAGDQMQFLQNAVGAIAGPFDSFLALRGLKTLALRMERHSENALEIARWLSTEKKIAKLMYPGLEKHPQHELAKKQMRGFGGMVTMVLETDLAGTRRFLENTHLFSLAESLGGVESLVNHPALMTHGSIPPETRNSLGITDSLVRLSVGVEDVEDLKDDLRTALAAI